MSRLQDRRYLLAGGAIAAVAIAAIGWLAVISPQLSSASSLRNQATTASDQNFLLQAKANKLKSENDKISALTASLNRAVVALPFDSGLPEFTHQISAQATQNNVTLTSITVAAATAAGTSNGAGAASGTGATGTGGAATSGSSGVFAIPMTLVATGRATDQLEFLKAVQVDGPRRALVTSTQFSPLGKSTSSQSTSIDGASTMTVQLTIFTTPLTPQQKTQLVKMLNGDVSSK